MSGIWDWFLRPENKNMAYILNTVFWLRLQHGFECVWGGESQGSHHLLLMYSGVLDTNLKKCLSNNVSQRKRSKQPLCLWWGTVNGWCGYQHCVSTRSWLSCQHFSCFSWRAQAKWPVEAFAISHKRSFRNLSCRGPQYRWIWYYISEPYRSGTSGQNQQQHVDTKHEKPCGPKTVETKPIMIFLPGSLGPSLGTQQKVEPLHCSSSPSPSSAPAPTTCSLKPS